MNRYVVAAHEPDGSVPRVRGDEPFMGGSEEASAFVFPACAGMNRAPAQ